MGDYELKNRENQRRLNQFFISIFVSAKLNIIAGLGLYSPPKCIGS